MDMNEPECSKNPKYECRNPKQIQISNPKCPKRLPSEQFMILRFIYSNLFRISILGLRIYLLLSWTTNAISSPSLDPKKSINQYVHDVWTADNGLPQTSVQAIAQTADGYLWLGTQEGLCRFDGVRFALFNK